MKKLFGKYGVQFVNPTSEFDGCNEKWVMTTIHDTREQAETKCNELVDCGWEYAVRIVIVDEHNIETF